MSLWIKCTRMSVRQRQEHLMTSIVHCRFHLGNVEWDDEEGKRGSRGRGGGNVEEEVEESKMESKMESKEEEDEKYAGEEVHTSSTYIITSTEQKICHYQVAITHGKALATNAKE